MKKGAYIDEEIISLKEVYRRITADYNLLTDEVFVHGEKFYFKWFSIFDGLFRILLPENFAPMPEQIAKVRYISSYRPPIILSGPNYDINVGFHLLENVHTELDKLIRQMQKTVLLHAPETMIYGNGSIDSSNMEGKWFEYKNFTVDEETYNMQFLIRAGIYLLVGTFNCRMLFYDEWKPLVLKSLEQIEWKEKDKQADESR